MNEAQRAVRRLLLDGVKILQPYRRELHNSFRKPDGSIDDEAIKKEIALMDLWMKMARTVALKLKRGSQPTVGGDA